MLTEKIIQNELLRLGLTPNLLGFDYLTEAIMLIDTDKALYIKAISKRLYPDIAKKFESTPTRVERAIRHAISKVVIECEMTIFKEMFGDRESLTNSEFISLMVLRLNEKNESLAG